jgi:thymidylate kinase
MTKKLLNEGKSVIVARGFSSVSSLNPYVHINTDLNKALINVIRLKASIKKLKKRVQNQTRKSGFNPTTTSAELLEWIEKNPLEAYKDETVIDANKSINAVADDITKVLPYPSS